MTANAQPENQTDRRFTISELANEFSVTLRALRFYEVKGLLAPTRNGKFRSYSRRDRARLQLILLGKKVDLTLMEIKEIIELYDLDDGGLAQRRAAVAKLRSQAQVLQKQIQDKRHAIDELHQMCQMIENIDQPDEKFG